MAKIVMAIILCSKLTVKENIKGKQFISAKKIVKIAEIDHPWSSDLGYFL